MKDSDTMLNNLVCSIQRQNRYSPRSMVKPVRFYCHAPEAGSVSLVGRFNGWNPLANPMDRQPDGSWTAQIDLHQGHHEYRFLVDGEPVLDPGACGIARDEKNRPVSLIAVS